ncbi:MAG: hypothetical protein M3680_08350 [Myxococcota bacterium]|nr:hypothetical protein [Myxococcota bacterium]
MRSAVAIIVGLVASLSAPAHADEPWEQGVPTATRDAAQALFREGNQLFAQEAHPGALEKYKAAIALWDHPLIRFNMAVTQIRLDRILEAAAELEAALRFGSAPFTPELHRQALDYQKLVGGRVGNLEASCTVAGAQVLLDGKPWFTCPGTQQQRVLTGEHVLVGEHAGYLTISQRVVVTSGATASAPLALVPFESAVTLEYPSARWKPWTTAGIGAAVALGGVGFWFVGRDQMDAFEADFAIRCPDGCRADLADVPELARDRDSAQLRGAIGISMMAVGGVVAVGGIVWAIMNRPRRVLPELAVAPTAGGMAARAGWRF